MVEYNNQPFSCPFNQPPSTSQLKCFHSANNVLLESIYLGKYRVEQVLYCCAEFTVYKVIEIDDPSLKPMVVKVAIYSATDKTLESSSLLREVKALKNVYHPNIIQIKEYGFDGQGFFYVVREYLKGETLSALLGKPETVDLSNPILSLQLVKQLLSGLQAIHRANIVHRNLKPDNIVVLLGEAKEFFLIKIIDFDMAKPMSGWSGEITQRHVIKGTLTYMSPEQLRSLEADVTADVYACGLILYELLSGEKPFYHLIKDNLFKRTPEDDLIPLKKIKPELPHILNKIICRATANAVLERYQTANAMLVDIEKAIQCCSSISYEPNRFKKIKDPNPESVSSDQQIEKTTTQNMVSFFKKLFNMS